MELREPPVIEIRGLTKSFGTQPVLEDIDLDVYPGEIMVIIGGSGCGKSTLLRQMIGSLAPDRGSIRMFGAEITATSEGNLNKLRKRFGVLFQSGALFNSLSIGENVALLLREHTQLDAHTIETMVKIKLELVVPDDRAEAPIVAARHGAATIARHGHVGHPIGMLEHGVARFLAGGSIPHAAGIIAAGG